MVVWIALATKSMLRLGTRSGLDSAHREATCLSKEGYGFPT